MLIKGGKKILTLIVKDLGPLQPEVIMLSADEQILLVEALDKGEVEVERVRGEPNMPRYQAAKNLEGKKLFTWTNVAAGGSLARSYVRVGYKLTELGEEVARTVSAS